MYKYLTCPSHLRLDTGLALMSSIFSSLAGAGSF